MRNLSKNISMVFAAGCLGGLVNSLAVWIFGDLGINAVLGVRIAPALTPQWLYPRIIWGGIWGLLFLLPLMRSRILSRGIIFSLGPTLVQLLVVFPLKAGKGYMGLDLGTLTPLLVFIFNAIWGIATAIWLRWTSRL
ncbi:MAG: hypothetical protein JSV55_00170 [Deltaproteobacteria bacterium]|nr:MAG: hypothetical protein JSV40_05640 [Deltaproteobacteria bacterium]UCH07454.1 MAG: hypothetical protein JSV55_00170 [Deltaproteobacteria bacterium]